MSDLEIIENFKDAIRAEGITPPAHIEADGKPHRFSTNGKAKDRAGYYTLHLDGVAAGGFGCFRLGIKQTWCSCDFKKLSQAEKDDYTEKMARIRIQQDEEERLRHKEARQRAGEIWNQSKEITNHPYLEKKQVKAYGVKESIGSVVVPVCDGDVIHSLQFIKSYGSKRFLTGGRKKGCYFTIGNLTNVICIAEGYATAASVHEATGYMTIVAFDSGNLLAVGKAIREKYPEAKLIFCADDDTFTDGNPGLAKAKEAAIVVGGYVAVPDFGDTRQEDNTDFNDVFILYGAEIVKNQIQKAEKAKENAIEQKIKLIRGSEVTPEPIEWIWPAWLAKGKLHLLAGSPGTGKTTIALSFAATISVGGAWPDGTHCLPQNVLIWSGEDGIEDTLMPRLLAQGADRKKIFFIGDVKTEKNSRPFDPARDMSELINAAKAVGNIGLLIIDPIVNMVSGDGNKNNEVRRSLQPLVDLSAELQCAALGITHLTKGTAGRDPLERVTGSIAFGALARIVLGTIVKVDESGKKVNLLARAKSNIGKNGDGFHYDIRQVEVPDYKGVSGSMILWDRQLVQGSARELLADSIDNGNAEQHTALLEAKEFLTTILANGPLSQKQIESEVKAAGLSEKTVRRAKQALKIKSKKSGFAEGGEWFWELPVKMPKDSHEDAQQKSMAILATLGKNDHLSVNTSNTNINNLTTKMAKYIEGGQDGQSFGLDTLEEEIGHLHSGDSKNNTSRFSEEERVIEVF